MVSIVFSVIEQRTYGKSLLMSFILSSLIEKTNKCQEPMSRSMQLFSCHGVFIDRFIFRSNLLWMRLPWECHNQSQDTNWLHSVTGQEPPFFHKRNGVLKIDQSVKMPWHRLSMGVGSSWSSAPGLNLKLKITFPILARVETMWTPTWS